MSSPILRGGDSSSPAAGLRDTVRSGAAAALERVVLPDAVRQRRRRPGRACARRRTTFSTNVLDRYILAKTRELVDGRHERRWTPTTCSARARTVRVVPRHADQLVHPPLPGAVLGRRRDAIDTLHTVLDVLVPGGGAAAAVRDRRGARRAPRRRPSPERRSVHLADWPRRRGSAWRRGTGAHDGRGARRVLGHAVRAQDPRAPGAPAAGARSPSLRRTPARSSRSSTSSPTRSTSARWSSRTTSMRWPASSYRSCRRRSAPASGPDTQHVIRAVREGEWTTDGRRGRGRRAPAGAGRVRPDAAGRRRPTGRASTALGQRGRRRRAERRRHPRAGDRGPGAATWIRMVQQARRDKRPRGDRPDQPADQEPTSGGRLSSAPTRS